jgi:hypothetical protein
MISISANESRATKDGSCLSMNSRSIELARRPVQIQLLFNSNFRPGRLTSRIVILVFTTALFCLWFTSQNVFFSKVLFLIGFRLKYQISFLEPRFSTSSNWKVFISNTFHKSLLPRPLLLSLREFQIKFPVRCSVNVHECSRPISLPLVAIIEPTNINILSLTKKCLLT